jgi:hypothetical protein
MKPKVKEIIKRLKVGIAKVESGTWDNPYEARPPIDPETGKPKSSATGKYQFLDIWFGDKNEKGKPKRNAAGQLVIGIQSFAKKSGAFGEVNSMEDFMNSPALQEAYFEYYAENVLIPEAKKIASKNPLNLSFDEIASQVHFQGYSKAKDTIQSGKLLSETESNASQKKYLELYNKAIQKAKLEKTPVKEVIKNDPSRKERAEAFRKRDNAIERLDISKKHKELERLKLHKEYLNSGEGDIVNEYIEFRNKKLLKEDPAATKIKPYDLTKVENQIIKNAEEVESVDKIDPSVKSGEQAQTQKASETSNNNPDKEKTVGANTPTEIDEVQQMFNTQLALPTDSGKASYSGNTKREMPIDALMGLALGVKGATDASDIKIPRRTEAVSNMVENFVAELAKRKEQGLSPAEEQQATQALADAYSAGMENIKNASGGNRAAILGNLGRLDAQNMRGQLAIQLADFQAKDRAFQMYGEAIQYIDQVENNKNIANTGIAIEEARRNRQMSEALGASGFKRMVDGVREARDRGPGSAFDMFRSQAMQEMFGFDPKMKDDGSPGTKSWYENQKLAAFEKSKAYKKANDIYGSLDPERKKMVQEFNSITGNRDNTIKMINTLAENPWLDPKDFRSERLSPDVNDYTKLFENIGKPVDGQPNTIDIPTETLGVNPKTQRTVEPVAWPEQNEDSATAGKKLYTPQVSSEVPNADPVPLANYEDDNVQKRINDAYSNYYENQ